MMNLRQFAVSRITKLYPFYSGCGTFANLPFVQKIAGQSTKQLWTRVRGGRLLAPLDDYIGRAAYYTGDLDRKITWACSKIVRPGDTVIDIGANIGLVTLHLASIVGGHGQVHSFEPNPKLVSLLRTTLESNHIENTVIHEVALGDKNGDLELKIPSVNAGAGSFVRNDNIANCTSVKVPVKTLSEILSQENVKSIRLLKIDVEGYEPQVFAGCDVFFQSVKPDVIIFEVNDTYDGTAEHHPTFSFLIKHGYRFLSIPRCFCRMKLKNFNPFDSNTSDNHDFLAIKNDEVYENLSHIISTV